MSKHFQQHEKRLNEKLEHIKLPQSTILTLRSSPDFLSVQVRLELIWRPQKHLQTRASAVEIINENRMLIICNRKPHKLYNSLFMQAGTTVCDSSIKHKWMHYSVIQRQKYFKIQGKALKLQFYSVLLSHKSKKCIYFQVFLKGDTNPTINFGYTTELFVKEQSPPCPLNTPPPKEAKTAEREILSHLVGDILELLKVVSGSVIL